MDLKPERLFAAEDDEDDEEDWDYELDEDLLDEDFYDDFDLPKKNSSEKEETGKQSPGTDQELSGRETPESPAQVQSTHRYEEQTVSRQHISGGHPDTSESCVPLAPARNADKGGERSAVHGQDDREGEKAARGGAKAVPHSEEHDSAEERYSTKGAVSDGMLSSADVSKDDDGCMGRAMRARPTKSEEPIRSDDVVSPKKRKSSETSIKRGSSSGSTKRKKRSKHKDKSEEKKKAPDRKASKGKERDKEEREKEGEQLGNRAVSAPDTTAAKRSILSPRMIRIGEATNRKRSMSTDRKPAEGHFNPLAHHSSPREAGEAKSPAMLRHSDQRKGAKSPAKKADKRSLVGSASVPAAYGREEREALPQTNSRPTLVRSHKRSQTQADLSLCSSCLKGLNNVESQRYIAMVMAHVLSLANLSDKDKFFVLNYVHENRISSMEDWEAITETDMKALKGIRANTSRFLRHQEPLIAATRIQAHVRGWMVRKRLGHLLRGNSQSVLHPPDREMRERTMAFNYAFLDVLDSETNYTDQLEAVVMHYKLPMRMERAALGIDKEVETMLFGNVDSILQVHRSTNLKLHELMKDWPLITGVGKTFLSICPTLDVYGEYVKNYKNSQASLQQAKLQYPQFNAWLQQINTENGLSISSLLAQPISRIGKLYPLLEVLCQHAPPDSAEQQNLQQAWTLLQSTSQMITKALIEGECTEQIAAVQRRIKDCEVLLVPGRELVMDGNVVEIEEVKGKQTERPQIWFLFTDILLITKPEKFKKKAAQQIDCKLVHKVMMSETTVTASGDGFVLEAPGLGKKIHVKTKNHETWVNSLKCQIEACTKNRVFGVEIEKVLALERRPFGVPTIVETCVERIKEVDPGEQDEIEALKKMFDTQTAEEYNCTGHSIHVVTGTLKLWFRELPNPLLTFDLYEPFIEAQRNATGMYASGEELREHVKKLPERRVETLKYLLRFLGEVCKNSAVNKMTPANLAIVFGPTLMKPKYASIETSLHSPLVNQTIETMIEEYDVVFRK